MKEKRLKYVFYFLAALLLLIMLFASRSAGISCDEIIHYGHSVNVYNYFATHGADTATLNTPVSYLKYYGQSYDNIVTFVTKWLNIDDVYGFRNILSSLMGWMAIIITALFAIWLKDIRTGITVIVLFAVSPAFFGHSLNNLKDIPFAFAYIAGIFFTFRYITDKHLKLLNAFLLMLAIAFCISIRAGGLILICYLYLFFFIFSANRYFQSGNPDLRKFLTETGMIALISISAFFLSSLLWPYALKDPFRNIIGSYRIMAHYPATFRQVFEGRIEWSDQMPWYYLYKSMLITIPVVVLAGLSLFLVFAGRIFKGEKGLLWAFLLFTLVFPLLFVVIEKSNLYSSWRQFLFVYPALVILAATGITSVMDRFKTLARRLFAVIIFLLCIFPAKYMIMNHPYEYIYYNEFAGGLKGAYSNYETDYYYVSQTEASGWLLDYLEKNKPGQSVEVQAGYTVSWLFRKHPEIKTSWFRYEERSMTEWDYAIVVNRYIPPYQLKNKIWPPLDALHTIYAGGVPICAVIERRTKDDLYGYRALKEQKYSESAEFFRKAIAVDDTDEMIFYNFAAALYKNGQKEEALAALNKAFDLNPGFELALMYLGNIAKTEGRTEEAVKHYEKLISVNRKYFEAYVALAQLVAVNDVRRARELLRTCITMSPGYREAIVALGDTYRDSDPEIAKKYYEQADNLN